MTENSIFISYSQRDEIYVHNLARRLQDVGMVCWHYNQDQKPGDDYISEIMKQIEHALVIVVVVSRNSANSHAILNEILYARRLNKRIIGLFLEPLITGRVIFYLNGRHRINGWDGQNVVPKLSDAIATTSQLGPPPSADYAYLTVQPNYMKGINQNTFMIEVPSNPDAFLTSGSSTLCRLGRGLPNDVAFSKEYHFVSRQHARVSAQFTEEELTFILHDNGSRNGVFVNRQRITASHNLRDGDEIGLGTKSVMLIFWRLEPTGESPNTTRVVSTAHTVTARTS